MKKSFIFVLMILLVLMISGCTPAELEKYAEEIQKDPSFCENLGENRDLCYNFAAQIRGEPVWCTKILSDEDKKACFDEVASEVNNPLECEKFETQSQKDNCYTSVARFNKNLSYCDEVVNQRDNCVNVVAVATNNESLCVYPSCFVSIAIAKQNPDLCSNILEMELIGDEDINLKKEEEHCYLVYATKLNVPELCFETEHEALRNSCFVQIVLNTSNVRICENIYVSEEPNIGSHSFLNRTEQYKVDNCYLHIAKENPKKCDDAIHDSMKLRNACYYKIARVTDNPKICENIIIPGIENITCEAYLNYHNLIPTPEF